MAWDFIKAKLLMWQSTAKLTMHAWKTDMQTV